MTSKKYFISPLALLILAGFSLPASSFQPLITDDTGTQGTGGNQIELSLDQERTKVSGEIERVQTFPMVYTRGLTDTIDVFAGFSFAKVRPAAPGGDVSGNGNPSVGVKWRFYENEETGSSFAIKPELVFPVSNSREKSGLGTGKLSGNLNFIFTQEVPFGAVHFNAGIGNERYRDSQSNPNATLRRASIAPVWDVSEQWKLALDLGVESSRADGDTVHSKFVEFAAIYSPEKDIELAFGAIRASDNQSPKSTTHTATAGITWRFQ